MEQRAGTLLRPYIQQKCSIIGPGRTSPLRLSHQPIGCRSDFVALHTKRDVHCSAMLARVITHHYSYGHNQLPSGNLYHAVKKRRIRCVQRCVWQAFDPCTSFLSLDAQLYLLRFFEPARALGFNKSSFPTAMLDLVPIFHTTII